MTRPHGLVAADPGKMPGSRRASPIPPEARRTSIAAAALGLLLEHGGAVTTRQIACAANIAEGTIFRVFADKEEVFRAAVDLALDPASIERSLTEIDRSLPLEGQLEAAVVVLQRRMGDINRLVSAVGGPAFRAGRERPLPELSALISLFKPHCGRLRYPPERAARLLTALTLSFSHPLFGDLPLSAPEIVTLFLDGIRAHPVASDDKRPS